MMAGRRGRARRYDERAGQAGLHSTRLLQRLHHSHDPRPARSLRRRATRLYPSPRLLTPSFARAFLAGVGLAQPERLLESLPTSFFLKPLVVVGEVLRLLLNT